MIISNINRRLIECSTDLNLKFFSMLLYLQSNILSVSLSLALRWLSRSRLPLSVLCLYWVFWLPGNVLGLTSIEWRAHFYHSTLRSHPFLDSILCTGSRYDLEIFETSELKQNFASVQYVHYVEISRSFGKCHFHPREPRFVQIGIGWKMKKFWQKMSKTA